MNFKISKDLKQLNKKVQSSKPLIMLVLLIISATVILCLLVNKYISRKIYLSKWSEYDDCGADLL